MQARRSRANHSPPSCCFHQVTECSLSETCNPELALSKQKMSTIETSIALARNMQLMSDEELREVFGPDTIRKLSFSTLCVLSLPNKGLCFFLILHSVSSIFHQFTFYHFVFAAVTSSFLPYLPSDLWCHALSFLSASDLFTNVARVSYAFFELSCNSNTWKSLRLTMHQLSLMRSDRTFFHKLQV